MCTVYIYIWYGMVWHGMVWYVQCINVWNIMKLSNYQMLSTTCYITPSPPLGSTRGLTHHPSSYEGPKAQGLAKPGGWMKMKSMSCLAAKSLQCCLVGGWPTPLKTMKVSWDNNSPYMEKNKIHVPNHQSVVLMKTYSVSLPVFLETTKMNNHPDL